MSKRSKMLAADRHPSQFFRFPRKIHLFFALAGLLLLGKLELWEPHRSIWDEAHYLSSARFFAETGFSTADFLKLRLAGSAGPSMYPLAAPILNQVGFDLPMGRRVSFAIFCTVLFLMAFLFRRLGGENALERAIELLACPIVLGISGLMLPEVFALLYLCLFLILLHEAILRPSGISWFGTGVALGLAILARQNLLAMVPAVMISLFAGQRKTATCPAVSFLLGTGLFTIPVFLSWGGLVNAYSQPIASGLAPAHALLALACCGVMFCGLYQPRVLLRLRKRYLFLVFGVALLDLFFHFSTQKFFLGTWLVSRLTPTQVSIYRTTTWALITPFAILFLEESWHRFQKTHSLFDRILLLSVPLIALTSMKITYGFSVRYVVTAAPLFLLILRHEPVDRLRSATMAVGSLIGGFILFGVFKFF